MKRIIFLLAVGLICFVLTSGDDDTPLNHISVNKKTGESSGKMYGIGSVSKIFTAAAVMKLAEQGKIDLDTPVIKYLNDFIMADSRYVQITPRMLLNHSSGFMGTTGNNAALFGDNDTYNHDNFLDFLSRQTLKHEPGERSIYSNDSFTLAEILIERVSGESYTEFVEKYFLQSLEIKNIKTPQSNFDRARLANIFLGNNELLSENFNVIGSGGIYATMEDLVRFASIFMNYTDGSILSRDSINEMAKNQHKMEMIPSNSNTIFRYGLGWDSVDTYPFNQYGITALSKGGDTIFYRTNLTVLPDYNLAVAVSASGAANHSQLIAQEIILAILKEEKLIPINTQLTMPKLNIQRVRIPENILSYAGIYDAGVFGLWSVEFTQSAQNSDSLILTQIGVRNERPQIYFYNTDSEFVSTDGDYIGRMPGNHNANGISVITFSEDKYLLGQTYQEIPGLSQTTAALPFAQKLDENSIPVSVATAWRSRNEKEYLLVSEKHTSMHYLSPLVRIRTDDRVPGYVTNGIYRAGENGLSLNAARIVDEYTALGYQDIPTMTGRDINNISVIMQNGIEYLVVNEYRYINSASIKKLSEIGSTVTVGDEPVWLDIDVNSQGRRLSITMPSNQRGSWFLFDDKMNCIATSFEKNTRNTILLPENGKIIFAGVTGTEFRLR